MSYEHILTPTRRLKYTWDQIYPENMEMRILKMGETFYFEGFTDAINEIENNRVKPSLLIGSDKIK